MKKININFAKIGEGIVNLVRQNGGTIIGGLAMIGLGVLCKKLDLPVEVLTNPYDSAYSPIRTNTNVTRVPVLIPNNTVESSIAAIFDTVKNTSSSYTKEQAVKKIMDILHANKDSLTDETKRFAITTLRYIANSTSSSYTKEQIFNRIANIGKGEL